MVGEELSAAFSPFGVNVFHATLARVIGLEPVERRIEMYEVVVDRAVGFRLCTPVVDAVAVATCRHQPRTAEDLQVVTQSGLRHVEDVRQLQHSERFFTQRAQNVCTQRIPAARVAFRNDS